jgi:hypothetical protein
LKQPRFRREQQVYHSIYSGSDQGYQIDSIIRQHLWAGGFDYPGVATGHGVSHGLGVIEGGASISGSRSADQIGLKEGMIMTIGMISPDAFNSRTRRLSSVDSRHKIGKCIRGECFRRAPIYVVASYVDSSTKVFKTGRVGLYPVSKEDGFGRVVH